MKVKTTAAKIVVFALAVCLNCATGALAFWMDEGQDAGEDTFSAIKQTKDKLLFDIPIPSPKKIKKRIKNYLNNSAENTKFNILEELFKKGLKPSKEDMTGWYSGKWCSNQNPNEEKGSIFIGRHEGDGKTAYSSKNNRNQGIVPTEPWPRGASKNNRNQGIVPTEPWPRGASKDNQNQGIVPTEPWPRGASKDNQNQGIVPSEPWSPCASKNNQNQGIVPTEPWPRGASKDNQNQGIVPTEPWPRGNKQLKVGVHYCSIHPNTSCDSLTPKQMKYYSALKKYKPESRKRDFVYFERTFDKSNRVTKQIRKYGDILLVKERYEKNVFGSDIRYHYFCKDSSP